MKNVKRLSFAFAALATTLASAWAQWTEVNAPAQISSAYLLTDGTVMCQEVETGNWWKLVPSSRGSYQAGTWRKAGGFNNYGPLYYGAGILNDGRFVIAGGEYDGPGGPVWTGKCAIYDPAKDVWTKFSGPWDAVGDTQSVVLPDGTFMIANISAPQTATLNPANLTWNVINGGKKDRCDEEGWTLLPDNRVLTINVWDVSSTSTANTTDIFDPSTMTWTPGASLPNQIVDIPNREIGPAVLMYDGKVFASGGNGFNAIYDPQAGSWSAGPKFPTVTAGQIDVADGAGVVMPDGVAMFGAGVGYFAGTAMFFTYDGTSLKQIVGPPSASQNVGGAYSFLNLPTGEVMAVNQSAQIDFYQPKGQPKDAWRPVIKNFATSLVPGTGFTMSGYQINGLTQGSYYGDDVSNYTNYPIVRLTNNATGTVTYCKTSNFSTRGLTIGTDASCKVNVPAGTALGPSKMQVIANGIASAAVDVNVVSGGGLPTAVAAYTGPHTNGTLADLSAVDGRGYNVASVKKSIGYVAATQLTFKPTDGQLNFLSAYVTSSPTATIMLYLKNNNTGAWDLIQQFAGGSGAKNIGFDFTTSTADLSAYVDAQGLTQVLVRAVSPFRKGSGQFILGIDAANLL